MQSTAHFTPYGHDVLAGVLERYLEATVPAPGRTR
jgi:hypothetical protein